METRLQLLLGAVACAALASCSTPQQEEAPPTQPAAQAPAEPGLHWFIPDGMRADPEVFQVFTWAREGKLPNIGSMMERGAWGWSVPTFPSHTPTNFATLLTGALPEVHGVADGPMRIEGHALERPSVGGFSSAARKVPAVWSLLESPTRRAAIVSVPGSTPPELRMDGVTIRGRWGGWGAEFPSVIFERASSKRREELARGARLFFLGQDLTRFAEPAAPEQPWAGAPESEQPPLELDLSLHGQALFGLLVDSPDDPTDGYDRLLVSVDRQQVAATVAQGEWSPWLDATFNWKDTQVASHLRVGAIRIDADGFFRLRVLADGLNRYITEPGEVADALQGDIGPMTDYVDSFPPQLIYYPEDRQAFLDEARMSLEWHKKAVGAIYERYAPGVFVHDIYSPNQMLTSRWWLGYLDPKSKRYGDVTEQEREELWGEVWEMYKGLDAIIGEALARADKGDVVVLSSDHGAAPLDRWVRLNNFFASKGWLTTAPDPKTGTPVVVWEKSKVVYLKMDNVYVHPDGLGGAWERGSGPAYEQLRDEVVVALQGLADDDGVKPLLQAVKWEQVEEFLDLPPDRVGDLVVANRPGYGWNEELTKSGDIFQVPLKTGYKQAMPAADTPALWTPFVIVGPGVRPGHKIAEPIRHIDQLPTILTAMGEQVPEHVQGKVLAELFE